MKDKGRININLDGKLIKCDDFVLIFRDKNDDKVEIVTNQLPDGVAFLTLPLVEYLNNIFDMESLPF